VIDGLHAGRSGRTSERATDRNLRMLETRERKISSPRALFRAPQAADVVHFNESIHRALRKIDFSVDRINISGQ
jgi:hypothetical protein